MRNFSWLLAPSAIAMTCTAFFVARPPSSPSKNNQCARVWGMPAQIPTCTDTVASQSIEPRSLYPALESNRNGTIAVDEIHTLFYQEYGRSDEGALTALFLHGGPGAGCSPNHARFFDPSKYRIVLLDQRGSGQSTPRGEIQRKNTLFYVVNDCEALRQELGIDRWDVVLGGSWGSTVALAYAQDYPERVRSLVLRGVCLMRPCEVDWLASSDGGAASLDPEGWCELANAVNIDPEGENGRAVLNAHYDRLLGTDPVARIKAARSWMIWEMRISSLARNQTQGHENPSSNQTVLAWTPNEARWTCQDLAGVIIHDSSPYESQTLRRGVSLASTLERATSVTEARPVHPVIADECKNVSTEDAAQFVPAQAMATVFYSVNARFAMDNTNLLDKERMDRMRHILCIAVQGGMDSICPPDTALDLHAVWPEMELRIPTGSGHSMYDPCMTNELVRATDRLAKELSAKR